MPIEWINFLPVTLLSPGKFEWAKKFITSNVWDIITQDSNSTVTKPFAIPETCPSDNTLNCALNYLQQDKKDQENTPTGMATSQEEIFASSTSALHIKGKRKEKGPLVETEVRRSCRHQKFNKGFKKSVCVDRDCLACHTIPPPVPARVVKNLNTTFCKANAQDTTEEKLTIRNKKLRGSTTLKESTKASKGQSKSQN